MSYRWHRTSQEFFITSAGAARPHIRSTEALAMVAGPGTVCLAASLPFRKSNHDAMKAVKRTVAKIKVERE